VWHDARYIADQISIQRGYAAHGDLLTQRRERRTAQAL
jgi:hypothetical protein